MISASVNEHNSPAALQWETVFDPGRRFRAGAAG
jgi:hypothetical protein